MREEHKIKITTGFCYKKIFHSIFLPFGKKNSNFLYLLLVSVYVWVINNLETKEQIIDRRNSSLLKKTGDLGQKNSRIVRTKMS